MAAAVALALVAAAATAGAAERARIAVLPIVVHSTEGDEYLRLGMAEMLFSRLGQRPELRVVRVEDPGAATTELAKAREAASAAGADYVLFGSFTRFGDGASLDVQCASVQGSEDARRIFVQSGTLGQIIPRLDDLAEKVARFVGSGGAPAAAAGGRPAASGGPSDDGALRTLEQRVEALERVVFPSEASEDVPEPGAVR